MGKGLRVIVALALCEARSVARALSRNAGALALGLAVVLAGSSAFATGGPCDAIGTDMSSGSTATGGTIVTDALACLMGTVTPGAIAVAVAVAFIPLIVAIWGLKGAVGIVAKVVKSIFSMFVRRG